MRCKKTSSSTLLATPQKNQDSARDDTLLVTEAFHLPSTPKEVLHRRKTWRRGKKAYFILAGISILILLYFGILFKHAEVDDVSMHSEKRLNMVRQKTFREKKEDNSVQAVVKNSEVGEILSEDHIRNEKGEKDVPVSEKTDNKDIPGLSVKTSYEAKALPKKMNKVSPRHTQPLPPVRKSTAFSNVFSYGMQNSNRMASPGTAEANLHSFRSSNNHSLSNRTTKRADRRRKRNADVLRFRIKDSGTRSVK